MKTIVYLKENGQPAVVYPSPEVVAQLGIQFVALKDVPAGVPFEIIEDGKVLETGVGADVGAGSAWDVTAAAAVDGAVFVRVANQAGETREIQLIEPVSQIAGA
jgi:hypothetical protein